MPRSAPDPRPTTADAVRTGHVITNPYARHRALEIAFPHRERFTSPEGVTGEVVRFSGWELYGENFDRRGAWVDADWGQPLDGRVWVLADRRAQRHHLTIDTPAPFGALGH